MNFLESVNKLNLFTDDELNDFAASIVIDRDCENMAVPYPENHHNSDFDDLKERYKQLEKEGKIK